MTKGVSLQSSSDLIITRTVDRNDVRETCPILLGEYQMGHAVLIIARGMNGSFSILALVGLTGDSLLEKQPAKILSNEILFKEQFFSFFSPL